MSKRVVVDNVRSALKYAVPVQDVVVGGSVFPRRRNICRGPEDKLCGTPDSEIGWGNYEAGVAECAVTVFHTLQFIGVLIFPKFLSEQGCVLPCQCAASS